MNRIVGNQQHPRALHSARCEPRSKCARWAAYGMLACVLLVIVLCRGTEWALDISGFVQSDASDAGARLPFMLSYSMGTHRT